MVVSLELCHVLQLLVHIFPERLHEARLFCMALSSIEIWELSHHVVPWKFSVSSGTGTFLHHVSTAAYRSRACTYRFVIQPDTHIICVRAYRVIEACTTMYHFCITTISLKLTLLTISISLQFLSITSLYFYYYSSTSQYTNRLYWVSSLSLYRQETINSW